MNIDPNLPPIVLEFYVDDHAQARHVWGCRQVIKSPHYAMHKVQVALMCRGVAMPTDADKVIRLGGYEHKGITVEKHEMEHTLNCIFPKAGRYGLHLEITVEFTFGMMWKASARLEPLVTVHRSPHTRRQTKVFNIKAGSATDAGVNWMPVRFFESNSQTADRDDGKTPVEDMKPRQVMWEEGEYTPSQVWDVEADFIPHPARQAPRNVIVGTTSWADSATIHKAIEMVRTGGQIWLLPEVHEGSFTVYKELRIRALERAGETRIKPTENEPILIQAPGVEFKEVTLPTVDLEHKPMIKVESGGSVSAKGCRFTDADREMADDPRHVGDNTVAWSWWTLNFAALALLFFACWMWALSQESVGSIRTVEKRVEVEKPVYVEKRVEVEKPVYVEKRVEVDKPVYIEKLVNVDKHVREYRAAQPGDVVAWAPASKEGDKERPATRMGGPWGKKWTDGPDSWSVDGVIITSTTVEDQPGVRLEWKGEGPWPSSGLQIWMRTRAEENVKMDETRQPSRATHWMPLPLP